MSAVIRKREVLTKVLRKLKRLPCLWNRNHQFYSIKTKRSQAYAELLKIYRLLEPNASLVELKKKLENMRTTYRRFRSKVLSEQKKDTEFEPSLWYYKEMKFLSEVIPKHLSEYEQLERENQLREQENQQLEQEDQQLEQEDQQLAQEDQQLEQEYQQLEQEDQQLEQEDQHLEQEDQHLEQADEELEHGDEQFDQEEEEEEIEEVKFFIPGSRSNSPPPINTSNIKTKYFYLNVEGSGSSDQASVSTSTECKDSQSLRKNNSEDVPSAEMFGKTVAAQLNELTPFQRYVAEKLISDVIVYARLDKLGTGTSISLNNQ